MHITYLFHSFLAAFLLLQEFAFARYVAAVTFGGNVLAYLLYMQGVADLGSMRASLIGTVEPISATLTSALLLGVVFAPTDLVGFAAIIVMIFLVV